MDTVTFFKNLKESDWDKPVNNKWKVNPVRELAQGIKPHVRIADNLAAGREAFSNGVKDVLSHLIGWERECARELNRAFETKTLPWFMSTDNYDEFNEKIYQEFKDYSPLQLLLTLEKWQGELDKKIKEIGEEKIKQRPDLAWVFDQDEEPHFEHHLKQVIQALQ